MGSVLAPRRGPDRSWTVQSDRAFTLYALTLIALVGSVITASVSAGIATLPTAGIFFEHIALSIGFRAAYKSFGGVEWVYDLADALGLYESPADAASPMGRELAA